MLTSEAEANQIEVPNRQTQVQHSKQDMNELTNVTASTQAELNKCKAQLQKMIEELEKQTVNYHINQELVKQLNQQPNQRSTPPSEQINTKEMKTIELEKTNFRLQKDVQEKNS